MKIKTILQRVCAFTVAIATVTTSFVIQPEMIVEAANEHYIHFKEILTSETSTNTTLLAGETIETVRKIPDNYALSDPFFRVQGEGTQKDKVIPSREGSIKVTDDALSGRYTLVPVFNALVTESVGGSVTWIEKDPVTGSSTSENVVLKAQVPENEEAIAITQLSTITLTVQNDNEDRISFADITTATGDLAKYIKGTVGFVKRQDGIITVQINAPFGSGSGAKGITLDLKPTSVLPTPLVAGTKFNISFDMLRFNEMILNVVSKTEAVSTIANETSVSTNFDNYVLLKDGDTRHTISEDFSLLHNEKRYNYFEGFKITWKWTPDEAKDKDVILIREPASGSDKIAVKINRSLANVSGNLIATVTHGDGTTLAIGAPIPITILGEGTLPKIQTTRTYTNDGGTSDGVIVVEGTPIPSFMDVNNGKNTLFAAEDPHKFTADLYYGTGVRKAEYASIDFANSTVTSSGELSIQLGKDNSPYVPGDMIPIPPDIASSDEAIRQLTFRAKKRGICKLEIRFYDKDKIELIEGSPLKFQIEIKDTSPSSDATLKTLKMTGNPVDEPGYEDRFEEVYGPEGEIDFSFNLEPNQRNYDITVPYAVESINLTPKYTTSYNNEGGSPRPKPKPVEVVCSGEKQLLTGTGLDDDPLGNMATSTELPLIAGAAPMRITLNGYAEDGEQEIYELNITRAPKSEEASLTSLTVVSKKDGVEEVHVLTPVFDPITYTYNLSLPYGYRVEGGITTKMTAVAFGDWGAKPKFISPYVEPLSFFERLFSREETVTLSLEHQEGGDTGHMNTITVVVESESGTEVNYIVNILIENPSENDELSVFEVYTKGQGELVEFENGQKFSKEYRDYYLSIPYTMDELSFKLQPDDIKAQAVKITMPDLTTQEKAYKKKEQPLIFEVDVPTPKPEDYEAQKKFDIILEAQAESDDWTGNDGTPSDEDDEPYVLHVTRLPPSEDSRLASMTVVNAADDKPVDTFRFSQIKTEYAFEVPYSMEELLVSPIAVEPTLTTVSIGDTIITENMTGKLVKLKAGQVTSIQVVVMPEAGEAFKTIYTLNVTRKAPDTEARLQKLEVNGGEDMAPAPFVPSQTKYTISIPEGTEGYTITAVPVDPKATISINGKEVENGQPSQQIISTEAISKILIVVTAEDGKTKMTYTLTVKDYNLMKKSDNANLSGLEVNYADLAPKFQSNIDEYELYVKPQTTSLDITPQPASSAATMKVFVESKELTAYGGIYSSSLFTDTTTFRIEVTSEDGVNEKIYVISVFKNDEEKQGAFKPITAEMVNYEMESPIIIDISNYAVIDASVFNKLKTDYPEKSIVFKGNDYMLRITGKDIKNLIPHETVYDLYFSFATPDEHLIQNILYDNEHDWELEPVYLYFDDHGPLPGPMILTVSLGREYQNEQLFWNYYNDERSRIDYYGYVQSNGKGTFTVPITHMSTYMVVDEKIAGSEDKVGSGFGSVDGDGSLSGNENANDDTTSDKNVPATGVDCLPNDDKKRSGGQ